MLSTARRLWCNVITSGLMSGAYLWVCVFVIEHYSWWIERERWRALTTVWEFTLFHPNRITARVIHSYTSPLRTHTHTYTRAWHQLHHYFINARTHVNTPIIKWENHNKLIAFVPVTITHAGGRWKNCLKPLYSNIDDFQRQRPGVSLDTSSNEAEDKNEH